jgi:hypothetical protein
MSDKDWFSKQGIHFQYKTGQPPVPLSQTVETQNVIAEMPKPSIEFENNNPMQQEITLDELDFGSKTITGIILIGVTIVLQILLLMSANSGEDNVDEDMTIDEMIQDAESTADFLFALNLIFLTIQLCGLILIGLDVKLLSESLNHRKL